MAVVLDPSESEAQFMARLLVDECAAAQNAGESGQHAQLLGFLRALATRQPFIIQDRGITVLLSAILGDMQRHRRRTMEALRIVEKLSPIEEGTELRS